MRRGDPQSPPRQPQPLLSNDYSQITLPQEITAFRNYLQMIRLEGQARIKAREEKRNLLRQNRLKQDQIQKLQLQVESAEQLQLRISREDEPIPLWTCLRYNAVLIITLIALILIVMWSLAPFWAPMDSDEDIMLMNETVCSFHHPEGWLCTMPEEERFGGFRYTNGEQQKDDKLGVDPRDLAVGRVLRKCDDTPNSFSSRAVLIDNGFGKETYDMAGY